jgi:NAD(P)-dependent dehydrogenase (short-subunit alcohol dehydrogenase family)
MEDRRPSVPAEAMASMITLQARHGVSDDETVDACIERLLMSSDVLVVIGVGGMGRAIARRLGAGKTLVLADFDESALSACAAALSDDGYDVHAQPVDVASPESVANLVEAAQSRGPMRQLAHTAGLSPSQATTERVSTSSGLR